MNHNLMRSNSANGNSLISHFFYILRTKNVSSGLNLDKLKLIHLGFQTFFKNMPHGIAYLFVVIKSNMQKQRVHIVI